MEDALRSHQTDSSKTDASRGRKWGFIGIVLGVLLSYAMLREPILAMYDDVVISDWAALPVTPLSALKPLAGTHQVVRVRVKLPVDSEINTGENLAYKAVEQTFTSRGNVYLEDSWWTPSQFAVSEGQSRVTIDLNHHDIDADFLTKRLSGHIYGTTVPDDIAALIKSDFPKVEPIADDDIVVYTLAAEETVTIFGVVETRNGQLVMRPPVRRSAAHLLVSALPAAKLNAKIKAQSYLFDFFIFSILAAFGSVGFIIWRAKKRNRGISTPYSPHVDG